MINFVATRFVLAVQNLDRSATFYRDKLGFTTWWKGDGWHFLKRDHFMVMLGECQDDVSAFETNNHSYFAYIDTRDINSLYDEYVEKGLDIISTLEDKSWGQREFALRTIDGHRIMFGESIS